jgi:hypothetical protein
MSGAQKAALGILALAVVVAIVWGATTATSNGWTKIVDATVDKSEQAQILAKLQSVRDAKPATEDPTPAPDPGSSPP